MKKMIALLVVTLVLASVAACGHRNNVTTPTPVEEGVDHLKEDANEMKDDIKEDVNEVKDHMEEGMNNSIDKNNDDVDHGVNDQE